MAQVAVGDERVRLPAGTVLDGAYVIEGEIGAGGFGITYLARDDKLGIKVAVKEYFPAEIGNRDATMSVHPATSGQQKVFEWGRTGFVTEAKMLAAYKHPNIVQVLRYFEAYNTAYMVLAYEQGRSLGRWLAEQEGGFPTQAALDRITKGLLDALETIHTGRLVHRDIAPDNIIVRPDGSPVVLDFGAARYELADASRAYERSVHTQSFVILKRYYSPLEQRSADARNRGPWSDVYALGATLYRAVTGKTPEDAQERVLGDPDPLQPAALLSRGRYRPTFLAAIDAALRLKHQERLQTVATFRALAFAEGDSATAETQVAARTGDEPTSREAAAAGAAAMAGRRAAEPARTAEPASGGAAPVTFNDLPAAPHKPGTRPARWPARWSALAGALGVVVLAGGFWLAAGGGQLPGAGRTGDRDLRHTEVAAAVQRDETERRLREAEARGRAAAKEEADRRVREVEERARRNEAEERARRSEAEERARLAEIKRRIERLPPAQPQPAQPAPSVAPAPGVAREGAGNWTHNGSVMRLVSTGNNRHFYYVIPHARMVGVGVRNGTLLFNGVRNGNTYTGTARIFRGGCSPHAYAVSGEVSADQRRIVMRGMRPHIGADCVSSRTSVDVLVFDYTGQ